MISGRLIILVLAAAVLVAGAGYAYGRDGGEDLEAARAAGESAGSTEGQETGLQRGYQAGVREGRRAGYQGALRNARRLIARERREAEEREQREAAAAAQEAEPEPPSEDGPVEPASPQLEPCVYGPQVYCTPEENRREMQAEALCGPGTPEGSREAAELGIQC